MKKFIKIDLDDFNFNYSKRRMGNLDIFLKQ